MRLQVNCQKTRLGPGLAVFWLFCLSAIVPTLASERGATEVDLIKEIGSGGPSEQIVDEPRPLSPQWVGTVELVSSRDPDGLFRDKKPVDIRLNQTWRDRDGRVVVARASARGHLGSEAAVFMERLPAARDVGAAKTLDQLRRWFGPQHGFTDGTWGDQVTWSEGWTYFTLAQGGRLRWLRVFALVSSSAEHINDEATRVDSIAVWEGVFRPADPNSAAEKARFRSAEEIDAARDLEQEQGRAALPEPLRSLVAAKETPGDSNLIAYTRALNEVRRDPNPELFRQLAGRISEGSLRMQGILEDILFHSAGFLKVEPWQPGKREAALRCVVSSLRDADSPMGLTKMAELVLAGVGGGRMVVAGQRGRPLLDIEVEPGGRGRSYSSTFHSGDVTQENLSQAADEIARWLRANHPVLRED